MKPTSLLSHLACLIAFGVAAHAETIPIVVDHYLPDPRPASPVKFGVPFPHSQLKVGDVANVRVVDGEGQVVPHQALVTATWNADGTDGVRWLLVDTLVDKGKTYSIRFNEPKPAAALALPPIATLTNNQIAIDTGPIQGVVATKGGKHFDGLIAMGAPVVVKPEADGPLAFNGLYVEHEKKGIFRADLDPDATVVLEESGPVRATLKADGWYANAAGEKFCRYSVRMHFFRGRQDVKLEHTFIYTGLSAEDRLRSVSLQLHRTTLDQAKNVGAVFGGDKLIAPNALADPGSQCYAIQDQSERGRFDFMVHYGPGNDLKLTDRGGGWMSTRRTVCTTEVAIRDAWQQYPWELELDQGAVRVHFWPKHGRLFDTSWDGFWWPLTERQKRFHAERKPHKETNLDEWIARLKKANATGAAKTHEVWLSFAGEADNAFPLIRHRGNASLAREVAYPIVAHADLAWTCSTRALDFLPYSPKNLELFRDEENHLQALLKMVQDAGAANQWYGWWDWGAYHTALNVGPRMPRNGTYADDAGLEPWHRARPKSHYGWGGLPWVQFMRTGQRDWLRYAQTYTLYSADRAHTHHTGNGRITGMEFHYDNSEVPWVGGYFRYPSGDQIASNLQGKDDYVYEYWLTGDRRPFDVLKSWGEMVLEKGGKWGHYKPGYEGGNEIRNAGMNLHRTMMLYQSTWDPRYLKLAKIIAASFHPLDTQEKVGVAEDTGGFHTACGWAHEGLWFYWNVTKDEAIKKPMMAFIDRERVFDAGLGKGYGAMRAFTYGYHLTGDELYLDLARGACDQIVSEGVTFYSFIPDGKMNINPMPRFLGTMATAPEKWRKSNLPMHERGRQVTFDYFAPTNRFGFKPTKAFFDERTDSEWSFDASFSHGGRIVVYRPDGKVATEQTLSHAVAPDLTHNTKLLSFKVPKDGLTGTYLMMCVEQSVTMREEKDPGHKPSAKIIRSDLPFVFPAPDPNQPNPFIARALFFRVPGNASQPSVVVGEFDTQREMVLQEINGPSRTTTRGLIPTVTGTVSLSIPPAKADRMFGLFFSSPPDMYFEPRKVCLPVGIQLQDISPYVAVNPEQYFVPKMPANLPANLVAP